MKRHASLRDLSSDHHLALVHARRLVQAAASAPDPAGDSIGNDTHEVDLADAAHTFLNFWSEHTTRHFREEEEVLLPAFARYGDPFLEPVVRVLVEHIMIRRLVYDLQYQLDLGQPSAETMKSIGELLRGHIRYEENVLFPLLESIMPEAALAELAHLFAVFSNSQ